MTSTDQIRFVSDEHKRAYILQMNQYAENKRGAIFALPTTSTFGDFAINSEYPWSSDQVTAWRQHSKAPKKICQLLRSTTLITLVYVASHVRRASDSDIIITRADFERLEATPTATAILMLPTPQRAAVIPRGAVGFDDTKKALYRDASIPEDALPAFSDCLQVGFRQSDMVIGPDGRPMLPGQALMPAHTAGDITDVHPEA